MEEKARTGEMSASDARRIAARAERRARRARRRRNVGIGCSLFLLLLIIALVALGIRTWQVSENTRAMESDKKPAITVEIPEGADVDKIAKLLEKNEVINNATTFKWYCKLKGEGADFKAGTHNFIENMSFRQAIEELNNHAGGGAGVVKVLVREGTTIDQIAEEVEKATGKPKQDFIDAVKDPELVASLVEAHPSLLGEVSQKEGVRYVLEGYLFPATYDYSLKDDFSTLITQMVNKTAEVVAPFEADIAASGLTVNDIMTMASLVEKEGVTSEDRKKIASVFYNRINQDMPIQSDISVLYALGEHKEVVTYEDLEVDSPYNLYKNTGLAPGPMNCPSKDAIDASVHPDQTDYIYFFANIKNGKVYFTSDYEQHLAWQEEYESTGTIAG